MTELITRLETLLHEGETSLLNCPSEQLAVKLAENKWSKKEILGHLIDSGLNNLQRFTEIQFEPKPYRIRKYKQDELVKTNNYQYADPKELLTLWKSINLRIIKILEAQTEKTLEYAILIEEGKESNLKFLIKDYIRHMEHHLDQITG